MLVIRVRCEARGSGTVGVTLLIIDRTVALRWRRGHNLTALRNCSVILHIHNGDEPRTGDNTPK